MRCEKCDHEFNYFDADGTKQYIVLELKSELAKGARSRIAYCVDCAPVGNTKIPDKLGV